MWYVRDVLYAVLYVRVSCFVVRGCGVSRRYIDVCYCDINLANNDNIFESIFIEIYKKNLTQIKT